MTPTIRDVALQAGVAPITVSRVINNSGYVSREARARVEAAIAELSYVPNTLARSLRFKKTRVLALVVTDITNPFWTTVARGAEDVANANGFNLILCNTDEDETKQGDYLNVLLQKRVDGFVFVPARSTPESVRLIQAQNVPVVVLDRRIPEIEVDVVRSDSEGGAYELVKHLLRLGHRRIAALAGPETISTSSERVAGYRRAMAETDQSAGAELVFYGDFNQESGYCMAQQALAAVPQPTAFFAANNFIAIGAFRAVRETGLRVPDDVALVCFDDVPHWLLIDPFLTIASQRAYDMGRYATELLLERLSSHAPAEYREVVLPVDISIRRSSGGFRPLDVLVPDEQCLSIP
jgi:LacI family transcriptional regulator, galactose operon repressor